MTATVSSHPLPQQTAYRYKDRFLRRLLSSGRACMITHTAAESAMIANISAADEVPKNIAGHVSHHLTSFLEEHTHGSRPQQPLDVYDYSILCPRLFV